MAYIETKHVFRIPEQRGVFFFVFFFVWLYRSLFITVGVFFVLCSYETLILVAGGIGVSPFVAILRDLLHRYQRDQPNLPSDVTLIWAVQKSEELQLLDLVSASTAQITTKSSTFTSMPLSLGKQSLEL
jgi:NAD(P)H-flavin reductase